MGVRNRRKWNTILGGSGSLLAADWILTLTAFAKPCKTKPQNWGSDSPACSSYARTASQKSQMKLFFISEERNMIVLSSLFKNLVASYINSQKASLYHRTKSTISSTVIKSLSDFARESGCQNQKMPSYCLEEKRK